MNLRTTACLYALIFIFQSNAHATPLPKKLPKATGPASVYQPALQASFKNGEILQDFATNNTWMKDFDRSNLKEGLLIRLSQVLSAFPAPEQEKTWKGRLQDFVLQQILKKKPMTIGYYLEPRLASPFAVGFPQLGDTELALFKTLLKYFANGSPEQIALVSRKEKDPKPTTFEVSPAKIGTYKFAYRFVGNCLAFSREPKLAASMSEACDKQQLQKSDIALEFDWIKIMPPLAGLLNRYMETSAKMRVEGDNKDHGFVFSKASMPWKANGHIGKQVLMSSLSSVLPSDTLFYSALPLVAPRALGRDAISGFLQKNADFTGDSKLATTDSQFAAVVFAAPVGEKILTGVLLTRPGVSKELTDLAALLSESPDHHVEVSQLCGGDWVLLSADSDLKGKLNSLCGGSSATLTNVSAKLVKAMNANSQHRLFLNLPAIGENLIRIGWEKQSRAEKMPEELQKSVALLQKLSQFYATGDLQADVMSYIVTQGDQ